MSQTVEVDFSLNIMELCRACSVDEQWVRDLQNHGVIDQSNLQSSLAISRLRRARRLERDFGLDTSALALVMDLLDEIERLKQR